jgi:hypothetical protein
VRYKYNYTDRPALDNLWLKFIVIFKNPHQENPYLQYRNCTFHNTIYFYLSFCRWNLSISLSDHTLSSTESGMGRLDHTINIPAFVDFSIPETLLSSFFLYGALFRTFIILWNFSLCWFPLEGRSLNCRKRYCCRIYKLVQRQVSPSLKSDPRTQGQLYSKCCYHSCWFPRRRRRYLTITLSLYDAHDIFQVNWGIARSLHLWGICNTNCCHPKCSSTATASRNTSRKHVRKVWIAVVASWMFADSRTRHLVRRLRHLARGREPRISARFKVSWKHLLREYSRRPWSEY